MHNSHLHSVFLSSVVTGALSLAIVDSMTAGPDGGAGFVGGFLGGFVVLSALVVGSEVRGVRFPSAPGDAHADKAQGVSTGVDEVHHVGTKGRVRISQQG